MDWSSANNLFPSLLHLHFMFLTNPFWEMRKKFFFTLNLFCPYFIVPESNHQGGINDWKWPEEPDMEEPAGGSAEDDGTG